MSTQILSGRISSFLRFYYVHIHPPLKFRFWNLFRWMTHQARLRVPYSNSGWITLDEHDYLQRIILTEGYYEPEVWEALTRYASAGEILWDIGAHIGSFSIRAMLDSRFQETHCFEPNPHIAEVLRINLALNPGNSHVHQIALDKACITSHLSIGPSANTGLSTLERNIGNGTVPVQCKTIDSILESRKAPLPTLMKIDVEGWEKKVLQGGHKLISETPPKAIVFETQVDSVGNICDQELKNLLETKGYTINLIRRPSGIIDEKENFIAYQATLDNDS